LPCAFTVVPLVALAALPCLAGLPAAPVEQWRCDGGAEGYTCWATCLVGQLTDDNGDGLVDERDVPDVVVPQQGPFPGFEIRLSILDGRDGRVLGLVLPPPPIGPSSVAIGDVDGDGRPDIVGANRHDIVVFHADGTLAQTRPLPEPPIGAGMLSLADIDLDGRLDVIVKRSAVLGDGTTWVGTGGIGQARPGLDARSVPLDLDPDSPGLEVLGGNTLHAADGTTLWQAAVPDGLPAVADLDGDGEPDIVLLTDRDLHLLDRFGDPQVPGGKPTTVRRAWCSSASALPKHTLTSQGGKAPAAAHATRTRTW
jgi:hypothetical protein